MKILTNNEYKKITDFLSTVSYPCTWGHKSVIPYNVEKVVCSWCGKYVFKSKEDEFKYRIRGKLRWRKKIELN